MKLRNVKIVEESGYPTYLNYLRDHKKELGIIAAGVGLLLTPGCNKEKTPNKTAGVPKPPIIIPVNKGVHLEGDMGIATPPKPQEYPKGTPKLGGKIKAPTPPQVKGKMIAPRPIRSKGIMAVPQPPAKKKGEMPVPKMPGKMVAPKPAEEKK